MQVDAVQLLTGVLFVIIGVLLWRIYRELDTMKMMIMAVIDGRIKAQIVKIAKGEAPDGD